MRRTTLFKQYLQAPEILMIPVAHDPLGARIVERAGFKVVGCAGYANSAALLGAPNVGLLTLADVADAVWRMTDAVDIPVWADGNKGHDEILNVPRTVRLFEKAGAASLMLEDQIPSTWCNLTVGTGVVSRNEFVAKVKAAVDARQDQDFTILARTDAIGVHGLPDAMERAALCLEAGADGVFLASPRSLEQLRLIPDLLAAPTIASMSPAGRMPVVSGDQLQGMGYAAMVWPDAFTFAYAKVAGDLAAEMMRSGTTAAYHGLMVDADEFDSLVGLPATMKANDQDLDCPADMLAAAA